MISPYGVKWKSVNAKISKLCSVIAAHLEYATNLKDKLCVQIRSDDKGRREKNRSKCDKIMKYLYSDAKPRKRFFIFHSFDDGGRTIQVAMETCLIVCQTKDEDAATTARTKNDSLADCIFSFLIIFISSIRECTMNFMLGLEFIKPNVNIFSGGIAL